MSVFIGLGVLKRTCKPIGTPRPPPQRVAECGIWPIRPPQVVMDDDDDDFTFG